jgi:NADP-dependent 3-hydroxy acid dehydrogenase YdfG
MIEVNLLGLLYCTHAALPHLLAARAPRWPTW